MVEQRINSEVYTGAIIGDVSVPWCKLKCCVKPMKDPLGVSPSKGNQGTTRGKEKLLLTSVGNEPFTSCSSLIPFTRANAQWVFHGLYIAL